MEPEKTSFDDFTFELTPLPAWDHADASMRLLKILGAGVIPISKLMQDSGSELDSKVVAVLVEVMRKAPVDEVMFLAKMLINGGNCVVGGDLGGGRRIGPLAPIFDTLFRGKGMTVFKLIAWAIKVNFSGFFGDLKSALPDLPAPASVAGPSSSTSLSPSEAAGPVAG